MKEEKTRLLKERLDQIYLVNEQRCSRTPIYGRDLLSLCSLEGRGKAAWLQGGAAESTPTSQGQRDLIQTLAQRRETLQDVMDRSGPVGT